MKHNQNKGFTIVELLIVIVVVSILSVLIVVSYNGIIEMSRTSSSMAIARQLSTKVLAYAASNEGNYPTTVTALGVTVPTGFAVDYMYKNAGQASYYCVSVNDDTTYSYVASFGFGEGACIIQELTRSECPQSPISLIDARDLHTYWVKGFSDGSCWMLTNLSYSGGGSAAYNDTVSLTDGTGLAASFTDPRYFVPPQNSNISIQPTLASLSSDGNSQYGLLYNLCATMAGQATAACSETSSIGVVTTQSICPSGWKIPSSTDFTSLRAAANGGSTTNDSQLRSQWLTQYAGIYQPSNYVFTTQSGWYWTSAAHATPGTYWGAFVISPTSLAMSYPQKVAGLAVRCVAI